MDEVCPDTPPRAEAPAGVSVSRDGDVIVARVAGRITAATLSQGLAVQVPASALLDGGELILRFRVAAP